VSGPVVLVTGGARGQGAAEARAFVRDGWRVVVGDVLDERGAAVAAELGDAARYVRLDVTDEEQWAAAVELAEAELGPLSALVNNAGIIHSTPVLDETLEAFRRVVDVNLVGTFLGIRAAVPSLLTAGGGAIVNISSIAGLMGGRGTAAYTSSKWGIRGLTKTAAIELAPHGIRVNSVHPGVIDTEMLAAKRGRTPADVFEEWRDRLPIQRLGTAEDVAELVVFLASDDAGYMTGSELVVDGGLLAVY
jgi:3alpha(or 20beta)-hydroxysteroid dehydrogenase